MKLFSIGKYSLPLVFAFLIPIFGAFNMYLSKYLRNNASSHYFVDNSCWGGSVKDVLPPLSVLYGFIFMLSTNNNI